MLYTIKLKSSFLGIPISRSIDVTWHGFPTNFNNQYFLMIIKSDESRELINMDKYKGVELPKIAFIEQKQSNQSKQTTDIDSLSTKQKEMLDKI